MSGKKVLLALVLLNAASTALCRPHGGGGESPSPKSHHVESRDPLEGSEDQKIHHRKVHRSHRWHSWDQREYRPQRGYFDNTWKEFDNDNEGDFYSWEDLNEVHTNDGVKVDKDKKADYDKISTKLESTKDIPGEKKESQALKQSDLTFGVSNEKKTNEVKSDQEDDYEDDDDDGLYTDVDQRQVFVEDIKKPEDMEKSESKLKIKEQKDKLIATAEPTRSAPKPDNLLEPKFTAKEETITTSTEKKNDQRRVTPPLPPVPVHQSHKRKHEPCEADLDCRSGRVCKNYTCVCGEEEYCVGLNKPVCGSDGIFYPSHCELHRVACVLNRHIKVDPKGICFEKEKDIHQNSKEKNEQDWTWEESEKVKPESDGAKTSDAKTSSKKSLHVNGVEDDALHIKKKVAKVSHIRRKCNEKDYVLFKEKLLHFHCDRFKESDCNMDTKEFKRYLATLIFSYYDIDLDNELEESDLRKIEEKEQFNQLSKTCNLLDMLHYEDSGARNGQISFQEFLQAFDVPGLLLEDKLKVIPTLATVGNGLEIKCGIRGSSEIIWRRHNMDLHQIHNPEITVFDDGSLYISSVGVHHMGNYSCHDRKDHTIQQIHILKVHMPPKVKVLPSTQLHKSHSDVVLKCHAEGIPKPEITWEINEMPLPSDPNHYIKQHENGTLVIHNANYLTDTGAYKCTARNQAGKAQDVSTVFIQNPNTSQSLVSTSSFFQSFIVFHEEGYTVYEPVECVIRREVNKDYGNFKFIPENLDRAPSLCDKTKPCSWGSAVNVKNKYVFVSQPRENRVVVVEITRSWNPVQVINTDKDPVALHYIDYLDQVWVLCWNAEEDTGSKTVIVIRDASRNIQHHAVHTQPIGNRFDLVKELFLPPVNALHPVFRFGYITHKSQKGLFKLDIEGMKYIKNIDLNKYNCEPQNVGFVPLGGHVIIQCLVRTGEEEHGMQLVIDYITDAVISNSSLSGIPHVSPDSQHVVTVNEEDGELTVSRVSEEGKFENTYTLTTSSPINDVTFFPSNTHKGYNMFLTSARRDEVIYVDLFSGRLELLEGLGSVSERKSWPWLKTNWAIIGGDVFSEYLMTPMKSSVIIINGNRRHVQCEFKDLKKSDVAVFAEPYQA